MSWASDDGLHEGYLVPEFLDGTRGRGISGLGVPDDHVIVDVTYRGDPADGIPSAVPTSRPAAEVVSWRVCCDCYRPDASGKPDTWVGPALTRVPSAALHDPAEGRIFAPDEDVVDVGFDDDVSDAAIALWRREHLDPIGGADRIRVAAAAAAQARGQLDAAVLDGRAAGLSWADVGRAAGMSRQSAHERWSPLDRPGARQEMSDD